MLRNIAYLLVVIGLLVSLNVEAVAVELQPHRAYYTISLAGRPDPRSEITDVRGTMMIEFDKVCNGWTVQQLSEIWRYYDDEGNTVEHVRWGYVTFENAEGTLFKFNTFRKTNDELVEDIHGVAKKAGKLIEVNYQKPVETKISLPEGTLFPIQHTQALLEAALTGEQMFPRTVFDGSSTDGASEINTFIGAKKVVAGNPNNDAAHQFASQPFWPVRFAVYGLSKADYEPDYVTTQELLPNGIIKQYVIDYGGMQIRGVLDRIELLPSGGC